LYAVLVGLPLAGISVVLHFGQNLGTSPSFGGSWRLEANALPMCGSAAGEPVTLLIEQSGPALMVRGWGKPLTGRVAGDGFVVADSARRMAARREGGKKGDRFAGWAHGIGCHPDSMPVRATRLRLPRNVAGH
jgi:hypothetical protein